MGEDERTSKHSLCLKIRSPINSNIGLNFFTKRFINHWRHLPNVGISCKSLSTFKIKLDEFMIVRGGI